MRIATWNIERLKHYKDSNLILRECNHIGADILVLTETDERIKPDYPFYYRTPLLSEIRPDYYGAHENRVSFFSKYPCVAEYETFDKYTAICLEFETERGNLIVYGTIMGIFGNREKSFMTDLDKQMGDIKRLTNNAKRKDISVIGDYNCTFSDNYFYTKDGRALIEETFKQCGISILTREKSECIDHISISDTFLKRKTLIDEWNYDLKLSDHKGIVVDL